MCSGDGGSVATADVDGEVVRGAESDESDESDEVHEGTSPTQSAPSVTAADRR
jgi:hypothetical protein